MNKVKGDFNKILRDGVTLITLLKSPLCIPHLYYFVNIRKSCHISSEPRKNSRKDMRIHELPISNYMHESKMIILR
jgi:hypothetical protein